MKVTDFFDLLWESFGLAAMDGTENTGEPNEVWDSVVVTAAGSAGGGFTGETGFGGRSEYNWVDDRRRW